jgi:hypothetical protein
MHAIQSAPPRLLAPASAPAVRAVEREGPRDVAGRDDGGPRLAEDRITLSDAARAAAERAGATGVVEAGSGEARGEDDAAAGEAGEARGGGGAPAAGEADAVGAQQLTPEEKEQVAELQARDAHVRSHEGAHQSAGGGMTGAASYTYQTGPDGKSYAIGGEVPIRIERGRTPEETIRNAAQARAAALAPADPSSADLSVAAAAAQIEAQARMQLARRATAAYRATSEEAGLGAFPHAAAA